MITLIFIEENTAKIDQKEKKLKERFKKCSKNMKRREVYLSEFKYL